MTRSPAQILADPDSTLADRVVASAYIRRLIVTPAQAQQGIDLAIADLADDLGTEPTITALAEAGVDPATIAASVAGFLNDVESPYARQVLRSKGPYPVPEETFRGWAAVTADIRIALEGLDAHARHLTLRTFYTDYHAHFARVLVDRL